MDAHHLKIFCAVYRNGSFTRASEELYISQPTVSEHIKNLEGELGTRLFDRLGRGIAPTGEADRLYPRAIGLLDQLVRLKEEVKGDICTPQGLMQVGASTIPGTYLLPQLAFSFRKRYPAVSFDIAIADTRQITDQVLAHRLLLGVVGAVMETGQIEARPFTADEIVLVTPPSLDVPSVLTVEQLPSLPLLIREQGSGTRSVVEKSLVAGGCDLQALQVVATLGSTAAVKEAVLAGLGCGFLSRHAVMDAVERKRIKIINIQGVDLQRTFFIISHAKRSLPHAYTLFREHLLNTSTMEEATP